MEQEFVDSLTPVQRKVYFLCLRGGMSLSAYARQNGLGIYICSRHEGCNQKKFKKVFGGTRSF
jgi:hypothetical protein